MSRRDGSSRIWPHLLMLAGACFFLFPFLWMVLTSFKTDQEVSEGEWWPTVPHFRRVSPYARSAVQVHKPTLVSDAQWSATLPLLEQAALAALARINAQADVRS